MNKKQLAKLLIKHPEIKALYESRAFDSSTINKIIAEEILKEDEDESDEEGKGDDPRSQSQKDIDAEIDDEEKLEDLLDQAEESFAKWKKDLKKAKNKENLEKIVKDYTDIYVPIIKSYKATSTGLFAGNLKKAQGELKALDKVAKKSLEKLTSQAVKADSKEGDEITSKSSEDSRNDMIQTWKQEMKIIQGLMDDPELSPEERQEHKEEIEEYIEKLKQIGVEVAKTDSIEDDKALVKSVQDAKPEIQQAASAASTAEEDEYAENFSYLDAKIIAALNKSKDAVETANPDIDLSDIEIVDDEGGSNDDASGEDQDIEEADPDRFNKALQWLETNEASQLFQDPVRNSPEIEDALMKVGLTISPFKGIDSIYIRGQSLDDVKDYLKKKNNDVGGTTNDNDNSSFQDDDLAEKPQEVKFDRSASKLRQLANDFEKLTDKQTARLAKKLADKKRIMALADENPLDYSPQEFKDFGESSAILMFEPIPDEDIVKLDPDISSFIKTVDDDGKPIEFEVDKKEIIDSKKEIEKMDKKLKEKEKMVDKNKAESAWANFKTKLKNSNVDQKNEFLKRAVEERLNAYKAAKSWEDLSKDPLKHTIPGEANNENFKEWVKNSLPEIEDYFNGVLKRADKAKPEEIEALTDDIGTKIQAIDDEMSNDASIDSGDGVDASGAEVSSVDNFIAQFLVDKESNIETFPMLFANDKFKDLFSKALQDASPERPNNQPEEVEGDGVDAAGTENSSDTNLDSNKVNPDDNVNDEDVDEVPPVTSESLKESLSGIYLTEEVEGDDAQDTNPPADEKSGTAISVDDAKRLNIEIKGLQDVLKTSENNKVQAIKVAELAKQAFGEFPATDGSLTAEGDPVPSVEEATQEGQDSALADSELKDMRYQDLYAGFKQQMDTFFSMDGKSDGFMDQFLLKYQAAKLAELIGNLEIIIRGDVPKPGEDNEGEARALSTATQQDDANMQTEAQGQAVSEKGQIELKTRLVSMLKGLKSLRAMMNSYKKHATRSSANPALDGSALKKSLQRYMSNLQINIKAIVETCYIERSKLTQTQSDDVSLNEPSNDQANQPTGNDTTQNVEDSESSVQKEQLYEAIFEAIAPALDGVYLMEDAAREEKMNIVRDIYGQMKEIYNPKMQSALENSQRQTSMNMAKKMMEFAKKEEFIALFPTFVGSYEGKPQTISQATDAIDKLLREFVETMKKVIVLAKGATIDETTLAKVISDLEDMSLMMENYFGVKSLLDDQMKTRVEKMLAQRPDNQALTNEPKPVGERSRSDLMDKAKGLAGKGLEKLKQMFSWMSKETMKLLLKFFGEDSDLAKKIVEPFGELIVKQGGSLTAKAQGTREVKQIEDLMVQTLESKSWFDSLSAEQQSAVTELVDAIYKERNLLQELDMSAMGTVPSEVRDQISNDYQMAMILVLKKMSEEKQSLLTSLMSENEDRFVSYLVNQHQLRQKMGEEKAKQVMDSVSKSQGSDLDDSERVGKSETEMKSLLNRLKSKNDAGINKILGLINKLFEEADRDKALSLLIYYVYYNNKSLLESVIGPKKAKKIKKFLDYVGSAQFITQEFKQFIANNNTPIVKLLSNPIVRETMSQTESEFMKTLLSLVSSSPSIKKDVENISGTTGVDADSDDDKTIYNAEVEIDDDNDDNGADDDTEERDKSEKDKLEEKLKKAEQSLKDFRYISEEDAIRKIEELHISLEGDEEDKYKLKEKIRELSLFFLDIKQVLYEVEHRGGVAEGIVDTFKNIKKKVKSSTNKFMSKFDLPSNLLRDLKTIVKKYPDISLKEYKSGAADKITDLKETGAKFELGLGTFLWVLYEHFGNIDEAAKTMKIRARDRREMDMRDAANRGGYSIDESNKTSPLEESLKPIIEKMLKEHYNH
jgi:hypothetical protein